MLFIFISRQLLLAHRWHSIYFFGQISIVVDFCYLIKPSGSCWLKMASCPVEFGLATIRTFYNLTLLRASLELRFCMVDRSRAAKQICSRSLFAMLIISSDETPRRSIYYQVDFHQTKNKHILRDQKERF